MRFKRYFISGRDTDAYNNSTYFKYNIVIPIIYIKRLDFMFIMYTKYNNLK